MTRNRFQITELQSLLTTPPLCALRAFVFQILSHCDLLLNKLISGQLDVEELDIETGQPLVEAVV